MKWFVAFSVVLLGNCAHFLKIDMITRWRCLLQHCQHVLPSLWHTGGAPVSLPVCCTVASIVDRLMVPLRNCCGWHIEPEFVLSCLTRSSCCHLYLIKKENVFPLCQNSCTLKYTSSTSRGYTPFELVVEDFPNRNITVSYSDGSYSTKGPLSVGRSKRQSPLTTTTVPTTTALFRRSIAPLSKLPLQFSVYGAIYLFFILAALI